MKVLSGIILSSSILFASNSFKQEVEYTCLNTIIIENGVKKEIDMKKSLEMPFIFTIKGKKLITINENEFDYKVKKDDLISYSNENFMLLLMSNNELGLVPKKTRGQIQYFFKCKNK